MCIRDREKFRIKTCFVCRDWIMKQMYCHITKKANFQIIPKVLKFTFKWYFFCNLQSLLAWTVSAPRTEKYFGHSFYSVERFNTRYVCLWRSNIFDFFPFFKWFRNISGNRMKIMTCHENYCTLSSHRCSFKSIFHPFWATKKEKWWVSGLYW